MRLGTTLGLAALVLLAAGAVAAQEDRLQSWVEAMRGMQEGVMGLAAGNASDHLTKGHAGGQDRSAMGRGMMGGGKMGNGMMGGGMMGGGKLGGGMMEGGKMGDAMMGGGEGAERPNDQWRRNTPGALAPDPAKHEPR